MTDVYILQNQDKLFLSKQRIWVDGRDPAGLYRSPHKDEAVNEMFEASSKDYTQRVSLVACPLNERRNPVIDPEILPPPQPKNRGEDSLELDLATNDTPPPEEREPASAETQTDPAAQADSAEPQPEATQAEPRESSPQ
ncbi:hypothetical protein [Gilvimarinus agarilyticus]|uniref:hypothetical protein n=1 Tax=Gilvimarinus agarilyticus TaxID=679259 RepID=UPI0018DC2498|nr:hypothetical protein [Gilvimarinus agarilyticus]